MKRLQQRTEYVARRAKQLQKARDVKNAEAETRQEKYNFVFARRRYTETILEAKKARREDWEMGPIAPRRHQTNDKEINNTTYVSDAFVPSWLAILPAEQLWKRAMLSGSVARSKAF